MENPAFFRQIVLESPDGIVVTDAQASDHPIVFVNPAFERLTGYMAAEVMHRNCRFLQGPDGHAEEKRRLRQALAAAQPCTVTLQNYRKDGSMFWNELSISPMHDAAGQLVYFVGIQKDISQRILLEQQLLVEKQSLEEANRKLETMVVHDELTGIYNRKFFDSQLGLQWKTAMRNKEAIGLLLIDIVHFSKLNTQYGHENGNRILKKVAEALNQAFSRSTDFIVRFGGDEFAVLAASINNNQAAAYARELGEKVRNLEIPPLYTESGYVMINLRVGVAVHAPQPEENPEMLLQKAVNALNSDQN
ncbi:MAG TPA: diguanylate cyclase [Methylophilaceae bacterium]|nr:diguanylate cyclase [Methylophilaceae bacterium]